VAKENPESTDRILIIVRRRIVRAVFPELTQATG